MSEFYIGNRLVGDNHPAFIIAEIGNNHNGDFEMAKVMIDKAIECGVDAVKFQVKNIEKCFSKDLLDMPYDHHNSFGKTYREHKEHLEFSHQQYADLKKYSDEKGIIFFATPFDVDSFEFLKNIDAPAHKISSFHVTDNDLVHAVCTAGKPIIMSTGMSSIEEIDAACEYMNKCNSTYAILQCTSSYPTDDEDVHLSVIPELKKRYKVVVGYSGHERGISIAASSVLLGASVIEKHFTLDRTLKGPDHAASLEPKGFKLMVERARLLEKALGNPEKVVLESELKNRKKNRGY